MYDEIKNYSYLEYLEPVEIMAYILFTILVLVFSFRIKNKNIKKHPEYKYFVPGVLVKLLGAGFFCFIYTYYYKGGDTVVYWESARAYSNLLWQEPSDFFIAMFGENSLENYYLFTSKTGYPWYYMYADTRTLMVIKLITPFVFLASNSFLLSTLMLSIVSFTGIWRLYRVFCKYYPDLHWHLAICILFLPSVVFWGSGILKDTITLSATCWFISSFYFLLIAKENRIKNLIYLVLAFYFIVMIKVYILFALIPGAIIWYFYDQISSISFSLLRYSMIPFILIFSSMLGYFALTVLTDFSTDQLLEEAVIKQSDLKREEYKGYSFDIGTYEPTILGAVSVAPAAIAAGLFRPIIWEARSAVTIISGLENFAFFLLSILVLLQTRIIGVFKLLFEHPLVMFCLLYSIIFSLIVGLSTSNFGALVRFKIAFLPMFLSALMILYKFSGREKKKLSQIRRGLVSRNK